MKAVVFLEVEHREVGGTSLLRRRRIKKKKKLDGAFLELLHARSDLDP